MQLLLCIVLMLAISASASHHCPPANRDDLIPCFTILLDGNHDGEITSAEIDTFFTAQNALGANACFKQTQNAMYASLVNGAKIVNTCDMNSDGKLSVVDDWNVPESCLQNGSPMQEYVCNLCYVCGGLNDSQVKSIPKVQKKKIK